MIRRRGLHGSVPHLPESLRMSRPNLNSLALCAVLLIGCAGEPGSPPDDVSAPPSELTAFVLEVPDTESSWQDLAFLATIPTSSSLGGGVPAVLATPDLSNLSRATRDLLSRLQPERIVALNSAPDETDAQTTTIEAVNAAEWSRALIDRFWIRSDTLVIASEDDYPGALLGSSLAALLDAPLLFQGSLSSNELSAVGDELGASTILTITLNGTAIDCAGAVALQSSSQVLSWLDTQGHRLGYIAVTNPQDRDAGRAQKASLFAPMYAARRRGLTLPLSLTMPTSVVTATETHPVTSALGAVYEELGYHPDYLAIVGAHDALPQSRKPSIFDNPIEEHPVSDLPYGDIDADPFLDIAIGRIAGDTVSELSNLAVRSANYELLVDGNWEYQAVESGLWGFDELRDILMNVGFERPEHLSLAEINAQDSLEVGAFLHKDHSACWVLGNGFELDTATLLAPAVVLSRGCSVTGMDQLATDSRSIVDHLLGSGAVAFIGASRNSIAQNTITEVSMWNHMLEGKSLGESFRAGINDAMVHWRDEGDSAALRYSIDIELLYGDPALRMFVPEQPLSQPANARLEEDTVIVTGPAEWNVVQYHPEQLAEWNYDGDLFMYTGAGASPHTYWAGSYDLEDMYFGVQVPLETAPSGVTQLQMAESPLGWTGGVYIDQHQDGTVTALWRVRLLDFDPSTGDLTGEAAKLHYQLN